MSLATQAVFRDHRDDGSPLMTCLSRLTAVLASIVSWPARVAAARAAFRPLAAMDARELADIGLTPADLNDATALPLAADPTAFLAVRAVARQRAREGGAAKRLSEIDGFIGLRAAATRQVAAIEESDDGVERGWARRA